MGALVTTRSNGRITSCGVAIDGILAGTMISFAGGFTDPDTCLEVFGQRWYISSVLAR